MPKVSICIPTYNQTEYLSILLNSILIQQYKNYEIIVTDDSSDNRVKNLLETYKFGDCLRYYKNDKQLGSPENWNEAIRLAKGEYIKIMHHDEWFNYDYSLTKFVEALDKNPHVDIAFSAARGYNVKDNIKWLHKPTLNQLKNLKSDPLILFFGNFIGAPSNIIFKRGVKEIFNKKLIWCVDFDFYIRVLLKKRQFHYLDCDLITSISNAEHNVTNYCIGNKKIEIFEYIYLYNEFSVYTKFSQILKYIAFFRQLFKGYNIVTINDIIKCGYLDEVPSLIKLSLFLNNVY